MKQETESLVNDVKIYSEGLILAMQRDNFKEAEEYVKKMEDHLDDIKSYIKMKKMIK